MGVGCRAPENGAATTCRTSSIACRLRSFMVEIFFIFAFLPFLGFGYLGDARLQFAVTSISSEHRTGSGET